MDSCVYGKHEWSNTKLPVKDKEYEYVVFKHTIAFSKKRSGETIKSFNNGFCNKNSIFLFAVKGHPQRIFHRLKYIKSNHFNFKYHEKCDKSLNVIKVGFQVRVFMSGQSFQVRKTK